MPIYYYNTKYGKFFYNPDEKDLKKAITTDSKNKAVKSMLFLSLNHGGRFIAKDKKVHEVEKEPELFFREGLPHILKVRVDIKKADSINDLQPKK